MEDINISMLGAQGTGKSSLLASMYYTFKQTAGDIGFVMKPDSQDDSVHLNQAHIALQKHLQGVRGGATGLAPSDDETKYTLNLGFQHDGITNYSLKLNFLDFPGGWIEDQQDKIQKRLQDSQVIIIAIDTPALVVDDRHGNPQLWNDVINKPNIITDIFSGMDFNTPKLVLFVPIKCETWMTSKQGIDLISNSVKSGYSSVITELKKTPNIAMAITPVQTLGNYLWKHRKYINGTIKDIYRPLNPDVNGRAKFEPLHVEQPLFYTLSFISKIAHEAFKEKTKTREIKQDSRSTLVKIYHSLSGISSEWKESQKKLFKNIKDLEAPLKKLNKKRKENVDGFEVMQGRPLLEDR